MDKKIIFVICFLLIIIPLVNADVPNPGTNSIPVYNTITNMDDYPDYVFLEVDMSLGTRLESVKEIEDGGNLTGGYCYRCTISVYAVKKSDFDESLLLASDYPQNKNSTKITEFLNSTKAKEVLSGLVSSESVPISSTQKSKTLYFSVDLTKTKTEPIKTDVGRNFLIYLYIGLPILALIIIFLIIFLRRK